MNQYPEKEERIAIFQEMQTKILAGANDPQAYVRVVGYALRRVANTAGGLVKRYLTSLGHVKLTPNGDIHYFIWSENNVFGTSGHYGLLLEKNGDVTMTVDIDPATMMRVFQSESILEIRKVFDAAAKMVIPTDLYVAEMTMHPINPQIIVKMK